MMYRWVTPKQAQEILDRTGSISIDTVEGHANSVWYRIQTSTSSDAVSQQPGSRSPLRAMPKLPVGGLSATTSSNPTRKSQTVPVPFQRLEVPLTYDQTV